MIGRFLGKRYEILERLGGGGMSVVFKARDTLLNRIVTIKILRETLTSDEDFVRRFRREAQSIASLSHPNIVSVYDVGSEEDRDYIVMEYIDGQSLKQMIQDRAPMPLQEVVSITRQILDALEHAHENNIIHRDIKPHNILMTSSGRVKVTDFGIARSAAGATVTHHGAIMGSVHYFSPEQARGEPAGAVSDLYSVGVVLFEMLTGQVPFEGETPIAVAMQQIQKEPPRPTKLIPGIPQALEEVILRALEKVPARRYPTARAMRDDLEHIFTGGRVVGRLPVSDMEDTIVPVKGQPSLWNEMGEGEDGPRSQETRPLKVKRRLKKETIWALAAGGVVLIGLLMWLFISWLSVGEVVTPKVKDMTLFEATLELEKAGFNRNNIEIIKEASPDKPKDTVLSQDPLEGVKVKKNRTIKLTVSAGPKLVKVPDLTNMLVRDAQLQLTQEDLTSVVQEEYTDKVEQGRVISQNPPAGSEQASGTSITLRVSKGAEPQSVVMPNLVGKRIDAARIQLEGLNLKVEVTETDSSDYNQGIVSAQSQPANVTVKQGETITLTVSKGPGPVAKVYSFSIPGDKRSHTIRIILNDSRGQNSETITQAPDQTLNKKVSYYGRGRLQVTRDGDTFLDTSLE